MNLIFSEPIRRKHEKYSSARIYKPKQWNINILILFMIAPLFLFCLNHILVFFVGLFEFPRQFFSYFLFLNQTFN